MSGDRQRQVLADLDIPLWLPRQPLAGGPHSPDASNVTVHSPRPLAEEGPGVRVVDSTSDPLSLTLSPMNRGEGTECLPSNHPDTVSHAEPSNHPDTVFHAEPSNHPDTVFHAEPSNHPGASRHPSLSKEGNSAAQSDADFAPVVPNRRAAAIAQMDWDTLAAEIRQCTACSLCKTRTQTVFGVGDRRAEWLVVGEAPGADEDQQGEPFVGRAGKLLNPMLQAVGLKREQVFIANILKCRPPDNRDPAPAEAASCRPFLERQITLIRPRLILAVGRIAAQNLLATDTPIGKLRGPVHRFGPARIPVVVTYHPAYLLRSPREKRKAWDDLRLARRVLTTHPPAPGWRTPEL